MEFASLLYLLILIPSAIFHEYMHGWVANQLGDPTAKYAGRLTLNPLVHIDPYGTLLLPLLLFVTTSGKFLFAYAKPVPYNPYNLRDQKWGPVYVAIAGPLSNLFLAFVFGLAMQYLPANEMATVVFSTIVYTNVLLAIFNLVPIPPLDGSKVLYAVLPDSLSHFKAQLERYGFFVLIIFMVFFFQLLQPVIYSVFRLFTGGMS